MRGGERKEKKKALELHSGSSGNYFSIKRYEVLLSSCDVLFRALAHPCVHLSFILRSALTRSRADPDQLQVDPVTQVCMEFLDETWSLATECREHGMDGGQTSWEFKQAKPAPWRRPYSKIGLGTYIDSIHRCRETLTVLIFCA